MLHARRAPPAVGTNGEHTTLSDRSQCLFSRRLWMKTPLFCRAFNYSTQLSTDVEERSSVRA
jgi:hypothetical protein